mmetsp:Transcript_26240/g.45627  ORF Transcript_26240/g.45627 Transcript_26240/m.45627 type:complete len:229 (-) Transcript_26240:139-825(-)
MWLCSPHTSVSRRVSILWCLLRHHVGPLIRRCGLLLMCSHARRRPRGRLWGLHATIPCRPAGRRSWTTRPCSRRLHHTAWRHADSPALCSRRHHAGGLTARLGDDPHIWILGLVVKHSPARLRRQDIPACWTISTSMCPDFLTTYFGAKPPAHLVRAVSLIPIVQKHQLLISVVVTDALEDRPVLVHAPLLVGTLQSLRHCLIPTAVHHEIRTWMCPQEARSTSMFTP